MNKLSILCISIFIQSLLLSCDFKSSNEYFEEAEQLEKKEKYGEAIILLDKAISKDPSFLGAYINRGADKSALYNFQGAIEDYQQVISRDSNNTLALYNTANNYYELKDYKKAVLYYNKAFISKGGLLVYIEDYLDNYDVPGKEIHYRRGLALYYTHDLIESYRDFKICTQKNYMADHSYYMMGYIYLTTREIKEACKCLYTAKSLGYDCEEDIKQYCK